MLGSAFFLLRPQRGWVSLDQRLSTLRGTADGALALYLTVQELNVPVARRRSPLADAEPIGGLLALLDPTTRLSPREVSELLSRIEQGGTLLYVPAAWDGLYDTLPLDLTYLQDHGEEALAYGSPAAADTLLNDADEPELRVLPHRWTRAGDTVRGVDRFLTGVADDPLPGTPLVVAEDTLVAVHELPWGRGSILVVSDPDLLANGSIREGGLTPILARMAAELTGDGTVLTFDEYHHGEVSRGVGRATGALLVGHPLGHVLLQWLAVALLALLAAGWRFGSSVPARTGRRRSPLEHVDALAATWREARALRIPRLRVVAGLARHLGRPVPRDETETAALLQRLRTGGRVDPEALEALERALAGDEELAAVTAAVDHILTDTRR